MGIFSRKKYIEKNNFLSVITNLSISLETHRDEYILGSLSQLKREGVDVSGLSRDVPPESELCDLLKGLQLTSMMGIAWDYIKYDEQPEFDDLLCKHLGASEGTRADDFRERYLDCRGDMECLVTSASSDIHKAMAYPEPKTEFIVQFQGGAHMLIGLSQVATYSACGDRKMEHKIRKRLLGRSYF